MDPSGAGHALPAAPTVLDLGTARAGADALVRHGDGGLVVSSLGGMWSEAAEIPLPACVTPTLVCVHAGIRAGTGELAIMTGPHEVSSRPLQGVGLHEELLPVPVATSGLRLVVRSTDVGGAVVAQIRAASLEAVRPQPVAADQLVAVYDLDVRGAAYSAVLFMLAAEGARRTAGLGGARLLVAPETAVGERRLGAAFRAAYPASARRDFISGLLTELVDLLPGWQGPEIIDDRRVLEGLIMSASATYGAHADPHGSHGPVASDFRVVLTDAGRADGHARLTAPDAVRAEVDAWLRDVARGRRVVTLLPRAEVYEPQANTDMAVWRDWAAGRDELLVLVGDPRSPATGATPGPWIAPPWNDLVHNQALFDAADANLAAYGEHSLPLLAGRACFTMWVPAGATDGMYSRGTLESAGFTIDGRTPFLMPHQHLVFESPSAAALSAAAEAMR